jgi:hypothetical protein
MQGGRGSQPSPSFRRSFTKQSPRKTAEKHLPAACWFYVSFSGTADFLGAAFVQARTKPAAIRRARFLGIHPGRAVTDILCLPIPPKDLYRVPAKMRNRLLNETEVRKLGGKRVGE